MSFSTLFADLAGRLFGGPPAGGAEGVEPELVTIGVEAIVDTVDPRLRGISGYQRKIAPGVARTITHMRTLARDLPAPFVLSRAAWASEPLLNALFATPGDVSALLGRSDALKAFFESPANAAATEACALLGALKAERNVTAPALVDGVLRHDVAQTTVSFSGHRLLAPAADLLACRVGVGVLILRRLAAMALERITALGERAVALDQRKAMLGARLRLLHLRVDGLQGIADGGRDESAEIAAIERELKATVDEYVEAKVSLATLATRVEHVNAIFGAPAEYVGLARIGLRVNRLGYKVAAESSEQASDLTLSELSIGDGLKAVIAFVRCERAGLPAREDSIARAARELL